MPASLVRSFFSGVNNLRAGLSGFSFQIHADFQSSPEIFRQRLIDRF
jgi:hypothetical protein